MPQSSIVAAKKENDLIAWVIAMAPQKAFLGRLGVARQHEILRGEVQQSKANIKANVRGLIYAKGTNE